MNNKMNVVAVICYVLETPHLLVVTGGVGLITANCAGLKG